MTSSEKTSQSVIVTKLRSLANYLRDPLWQFVGVVIAVAALIASFYVGQSKRELQILVDSVSPLFSVQPTEASNVEIMYKGEKIKDAVSLIARVRNSGNEPIEVEDYAKSISFRFSQDVEVIDYAIVASEPSNIGASLSSKKGSKIILDPVLLNEGDEFTIRFMRTSAENPIRLRWG